MGNKRKNKDCSDYEPFCRIFMELELNGMEWNWKKNIGKKD